MSDKEAKKVKFIGKLKLANLFNLHIRTLSYELLQNNFEIDKEEM